MSLVTQLLPSPGLIQTFILFQNQIEFTVVTVQVLQLTYASFSVFQTNVFYLIYNAVLFYKSSIFHSTSLQVLYFKYECNVVSNTVLSNTFVQFKKNIILCMAAVFGDNTMFKTYFSSQALFYASVLSYRFMFSVKQLIICNNKPFQN